MPNGEKPRGPELSLSLIREATRPTAWVEIEFSENGGPVLRRPDERRPDFEPTYPSLPTAQTSG